MNYAINEIHGVSPRKAISFTVFGEPRSKQRPRVTARGTYTPKETIDAEKLVRHYYAAANGPFFEHQLIIGIDFYNGNRRRRDLDNMAKLVLDALNKVAFADDYQVVELNIAKFFTTPARARTEITIKEIIEFPYDPEAVLEIPSEG